MSARNVSGDSQRLLWARALPARIGSETIGPMSTTATERACPECRAPVPVDPGFIAWCASCGWNLSPPPVGGRADGRFARLYAAAGRRAGDRMARRLLQAPTLEPRLTPGRVASYAIAAAVFVLALVLFVGGVLLAVLALPNVFALLFGVLLALTGFVMRPRLGRVPEEHVLARGDAPALYALADEIAAALGTKRVDLIALDPAFNASWSVVGFRRRRVLTLGLPMLAVLEPEERVAVVAHEFAHGRNGDSGRSLVVSSAVNGLVELYWLLAPGGGSVVFNELAALDRVVNVVFWIISRPVLAVLNLELHLLLRDGQRAEYQADALAASVAGSAAVVALHEKALLGPVAAGAAQRLASARITDTSVFDEIVHAVADVPERERERRRRVARLEHARLDDTHPPTAFRIRMLEERAPAAPRVALDAARSQAIDAELAPHRPALHAELLDTFRDALYAR
jgi:Zn-dependent protease with chaperone function